MWGPEGPPAREAGAGLVRLVFLGPPGSGKGTQAVLLSRALGLLHVAPGDMFRQEVRSGSDLGREVADIMARGELVPDEVTIKLVEKRLNSDEAKKGFVLDGFPRNLVQAEALDRILELRGQALDLVINLVVDENELLKRFASRRVCQKCGRPYNLLTDPSRVPGKCDVCGGELVRRKDDEEDTVRERLRVYVRVTRPLEEYYDRKGLLVNVDGNQEVLRVHKDILEVLRSKGYLAKRDGVL